MQTYAYIRVSTREQNEDRQVIAMKEFGVEEKNIVVEKQSGKDFECPLYWKLVKKLKPDNYSDIQRFAGNGRMEKYPAEKLHGGSEYHTIHFVHG